MRTNVKHLFECIQPRGTGPSHTHVCERRLNVRSTCTAPLSTEPTQAQAITGAHRHRLPVRATHAGNVSSTRWCRCCCCRRRLSLVYMCYQRSHSLVCAASASERLYVCSTGRCTFCTLCGRPEQFFGSFSVRSGDRTRFDAELIKVRAGCLVKSVEFSSPSVAHHTAIHSSGFGAYFAGTKKQKKNFIN